MTAPPAQPPPPTDQNGPNGSLGGRHYRALVGIVLMLFGVFTIAAHMFGWEHTSGGGPSNTGILVEAVFHLLPFVAGLLLFSPQAAKELFAAIPKPNIGGGV
jgi:hypothetical protein